MFFGDEKKVWIDAFASRERPGELVISVEDEEIVYDSPERVTALAMRLLKEAVLAEHIGGEKHDEHGS